MFLSCLVPQIAWKWRSFYFTVFVLVYKKTKIQRPKDHLKKSSAFNFVLNTYCKMLHHVFELNSKGLNEMVSQQTFYSRKLMCFNDSCIPLRGSCAYPSSNDSMASSLSLLQGHFDTGTHCYCYCWVHQCFFWLWQIKKSAVQTVQSSQQFEKNSKACFVLSLAKQYLNLCSQHLVSFFSVFLCFYHD